MTHWLTSIEALEAGATLQGIESCFDGEAYDAALPGRAATTLY